MNLVTITMAEGSATKMAMAPKIASREIDICDGDTMTSQFHPTQYQWISGIQNGSKSSRFKSCRDSLASREVEA